MSWKNGHPTSPVESSEDAFPWPKGARRHTGVSPGPPRSCAGGHLHSWLNVGMYVCMYVCTLNFEFWILSFVCMYGSDSNQNGLPDRSGQQQAQTITHPFQVFPHPSSMVHVQKWCTYISIHIICTYNIDLAEYITAPESVLSLTPEVCFWRAAEDQKPPKTGLVVGGCSTLPRLEVCFWRAAEYQKPPKTGL